MTWRIPAQESSYGERGFTLVELVITTGLLCLLAGSILAIVQPAHEFLSVQPEAQDVQQRLRFAAGSVQRDLQQAGVGSTTGELSGALPHYFAPVIPYRIGERNADPPGSFRSDAITLVHVPLAAPPARTLRVTPAGVVAFVEIEPNCPQVAIEPCGFPAGTRVALFDRSGRGWFGTVTGAAGLVLTVESAAIDANLDGETATIVPIELTVYALAVDRASGVSRLMRYDGRASELPLADHVVTLEFAYAVDPQPPVLSAGGEAVSYGPRPPPWDVDNLSDGWPAGENCTFFVADGQHLSRLSSLSTATEPLSADQSLFTDGPWCADAQAPNRFDADLLRIRRVDVLVRVQAALSRFRGQDRLRFLNPGVARSPSQMVPDQEIRFAVSPRNLRVEAGAP